MRASAIVRHIGIPTRVGMWLGMLTVSAVAAASRAAPPISPVPVPEYSFDWESPKVQDFIVGAGDVLQLDAPNPTPAVGGPALGLNSPYDDIDSLSGGNPTVSPTATFQLLFSVDRSTVGVATPDSMLAGLEVPYNPLDQAVKNQAAGDQYMSSGLYTRSGSRLRGLRSGNATLNRNNFDEGGTDFAADPPTSAAEANNMFVPGPQDNVDATGYLSRGGTVGGPINIYFTLTAGSPSLSTLPHGAMTSGANIYFQADPGDANPTELYAEHQQLGLAAADDIDAMIVFDGNTNGHYDVFDQVLFSLAPGSPSLSSIPGASTNGAAADVFEVAGGQNPVLFTSASDLGLGDDLDNIDALELWFCNDPVMCAAEGGIRFIHGDWDDNGTVDLDDFSHWGECMTGPNGGILPDCDRFDFQPDTDVDLEDFGGFQLRFDIP